MDSDTRKNRKLSVVCIIYVNRSRPILDEEREITEIFIFTLLCVVAKGFMKAIKTATANRMAGSYMKSNIGLKPFEALESSVKNRHLS